MKKISLLFGLWLGLCCCRAEAQTYDTNNPVVQTLAGSGFSGYLDGVGQLTMFSNPSAIVADTSSNLFVWDSRNYRIRKIAPDGTVTTFAGGGSQGTGIGTNVDFSGADFEGMTIDRNDTIWMVNNNTDGLYKITEDGAVTSTNLPSLRLRGICLDSLGNIFLSDYYGNRVYRYTTNGILTVFAGSGNSGSLDGNGVFTSFYHPSRLAVDAADNIYVFDSGNALIRRIDQSHNVTTLAGQCNYSGNGTDGVGTNAAFNDIGQMCFDASGNLILACGWSIRKVSVTTNVVTIAGSFTEWGYANGTGNLARFNGGWGVCVSGDTIWVADSSNQRIRTIISNPTPQPVSPANLQLETYPGLRIVGTVGRTYQIQSSPDMTNWTIRATQLLRSSPYLWFDENAVSGSKYYRALLLP